MPADEKRGNKTGSQHYLFHSYSEFAKLSIDTYFWVPQPERARTFDDADKALKWHIGVAISHVLYGAALFQNETLRASYALPTNWLSELRSQKAQKRWLVLARH